MVRFLAILIAVMGLGLGAALAQTPVPDGATVVSSVQARAIARKALAEGKLQIADALTAALLAQNPADAEALMIRALLLRSVGRLDEAREHAASAWRHALAPALRFEAAMLAADLLTRQERFSRAQFWLRRADQAAPDDDRRAFAARAFGVVRQRNPLQASLSFSLKPSNNVNNGAETLVIDIGGLPFRLDSSGQQLGGWEASAGLSFGYRLSETRTSRTDVLGDLFGRKVWLDSEAAIVAPDVRSSDYDYAAVAGGIRHQRMVWPALGVSKITGMAGQSWYGGEKLSRWIEALLEQNVRRSEVSALRFGLRARVEKRLDDSINDSHSIGLSAQYLRSLEIDGGYSIGARLANIWSESATVDSLVFGITASRTFLRIGPVRPRIVLYAANRDYQKWSATPGGREDRTLSLQLDATWPDVSYYGFVPQATLIARRTWSNVDIYDRNELSLGLTVVSRF
jgi:tetratricopeptide (TPR) repeat protein